MRIKPKLINTDTKKEVRVGDEVLTFRKELCIVDRIAEPGSVSGGRGGRVYVKMKENDDIREFFPSVINAVFVEDDG